jgi:hypothetical protein
MFLESTEVARDQRSDRVLIFFDNGKQVGCWTVYTGEASTGSEEEVFSEAVADAYRLARRLKKQCLTGETNA